MPGLQEILGAFLTGASTGDPTAFARVKMAREEQNLNNLYRKHIMNKAARDEERAKRPVGDLFQPEMGQEYEGSYGPIEGRMTTQPTGNVDFTKLRPGMTLEDLPIALSTMTAMKKNESKLYPLRPGGRLVTEGGKTVAEVPETSKPEKEELVDLPDPNNPGVIHKAKLSDVLKLLTPAPTGTGEVRETNLPGSIEGVPGQGQPPAFSIPTVKVGAKKTETAANPKSKEKTTERWDQGTGVTYAQDWRWDDKTNDWIARGGEYKKGGPAPEKSKVSDQDIDKMFADYNIFRAKAPTDPNRLLMIKGMKEMGIPIDVNLPEMTKDQFKELITTGTMPKEGAPKVNRVQKLPDGAKLVGTVTEDGVKKEVYESPNGKRFKKEPDAVR